MDIIKQVLDNKENIEAENTEQDCPTSPTIVSVSVMDARDTKVVFKDVDEAENTGSEGNISLVIRSSEQSFDVDQFLGHELAEFYKECKDMEQRIHGHGSWKLTADLLQKLPK